MKTVWVVYEYRDCGPTLFEDYKGIFATKEAAEAWREEVAEAERTVALAEGWTNDSPAALGWHIEEHEVNS